MTDKNLTMSLTIAQRVAHCGGTAYYVGGFVRDKLQGRHNKDIDLEIHGISPETLEHILNELGTCTTMGASFGVFGLSHYDLDIAMPRMETAIGRGHRDFAVEVDPFLGTEKAARRRDFTINALMENVLTGEIVDHFGGVDDLRAGIIRHVNDATFAEDPLRVLRAAQFAARFGFTIAPETMELCSRMDLTALAHERIMGELEKALLKSTTPSIFFQSLRQMGQLSHWFPELEALIGVEQEPKYHPEGDVWNHTMLVLDSAAGLRDQAEYPLGLMLSALCHDLGKTTTSEVIDGRIRAFGHEIEGISIAQKLLKRLTTEAKLTKYVGNMVKLHMRPNLMAAQGSGKKSMMRMLDESVCPADLLLLAKSDALGQTRTEAEYAETERYLRQMLERYNCLMSLPAVRGADLVEAGFKPSRDFAEALDYAHKLQLSGVPLEQALPQTKAYLSRLLRKSGSV